MSEFRQHPLTKTRAEWRVMGSYDGGKTWDAEHHENTAREGKRRLAEYLESGPGMYRLDVGVDDNPDYGRFKVGTRVKVNPETQDYAEGMHFGKVVAVGTIWVRVAWDEDPEVLRKFKTRDIAPA